MPKLTHYQRRLWTKMLRKYLKSFVGAKEQNLGKLPSKFDLDIDADIFFYQTSATLPRVSPKMSSNPRCGQKAIRSEFHPALLADNYTRHYCNSKGQTSLLCRPLGSQFEDATRLICLAKARYNLPIKSVMRYFSQHWIAIEVTANLD